MDNLSENSLNTIGKTEFEALFRTHYSNLCSYANNFLKDADGSEEVVQEVFFKLWTGRETLQIRSSVQSYLYRAVRNSCLNVVKHLNVREEYRTAMKHELQELNAEDTLVAGELQQKIREAIDRLPLERRKVFVLSRYEALTYPEIATRLGISVKTVENQMGKALKTLREELSEYLPWLTLFFFDLFRNP